MVGRMAYSAVRKNGNGRVKKLNKDAFKVVEANSEKIAKALLASTLLGHVLSARLLVELAGCDVDIEEALAKRPLITLAMRLAAEPQMPPGSSIEDAETEDESTKFIAA
jgi:hypothetical protein